MSVEVQKISKTFGSFRALRELDLSVKAGELLALLGPSGSGKTTLLRLIGGLELPDPGTGRILLHGEDVTDVAAGERQIGFVFQHYALFKHMTVEENVAFGLTVRPRKHRPHRRVIDAKVKQLLELVQLGELGKRRPHELSGGQRQRVALARALAIEPRVLLLDEPFGALDAKVRKELRKWIRSLHNEIHLTSIFVTHDQDEALEVADRVVVMNQGQIEQVGTPDEVYHTPANPYVFNFLGHIISLQGQGIRDGLQIGGSTYALPPQWCFPGQPVSILARPHDVEVTGSPESGFSVPTLVKRVNFAGPLVYLEVECGGQDRVVEVEVTSDHCTKIRPKVGEKIYLNFRKYQVFSKGT